MQYLFYNDIADYVLCTDAQDICFFLVWVGGYYGGFWVQKGSVKTAAQKKQEYREVIEYWKNGYTIKDVAKLSGKGVSTVQRVKKAFFSHSIVLNDKNI